MDIEIKDRVAVGDNKYTMRTLSDGRVELIPSPDSVQEPGTPLNKALLQPIVDSAYDVIYSFGWYPERNNALEFNDGQTLEGLLEDLNAEKAVKIKVKKSGESDWREAEFCIPGDGRAYIHTTEVTHSNMGHTEIIVHCWYCTDEDYNFKYRPYEVTKSIRQNAAGILLHSDSINALEWCVQLLMDNNPIVYNLTWNPSQNNALEFENEGQTLEGLIADLDADKNVEVKVKRTGTNCHFDVEIRVIETGWYELYYADSNGMELTVHSWQFSSSDLSVGFRHSSLKLANVTNAVLDLNSRVTELEKKIPADGIGAYLEEYMAELLEYVAGLEARIEALESK